MVEERGTMAMKEFEMAEVTAGRCVCLIFFSKPPVDRAGALRQERSQQCNAPAAVALSVVLLEVAEKISPRERASTLFGAS